MLLINTNLLHAQIRLGQNAILTISDDTQFSCAADIINYGSIFNSGTINLCNNWTNNGEFVSFAGTINFIGNQLQHVNHNGYSFYNLCVDGAGIIIESDLSVSNILNLSRGHVRPLDDIQFRLAENAQVENASEVSHVKGRLIREGTGDMFYPIGSPQLYRPAWLHITDAENQIAGLEVLEPNLISAAQNGITRVAQEAYWRLSAHEGNIRNTRISLSYSNITTRNLNLLVVVELSDAGNSYFNLGHGSLDEINEVITSRDAISSNTFALAEIDGLITICNVISPNGDAINDYLYITNIEEFPDNEVMIFNRAGQQIYHEQNYHNTWDGSINNEPLPVGNYFCVVKLRNSAQVYSQAITIVR